MEELDLIEDTFTSDQMEYKYKETQIHNGFGKRILGSWIL